MSSASDTDPATRARSVLADIGVHALQNNQQRVQRLQAVLGMAGRLPLSVDEWSDAAGVAHQLVGSAGTFGYARVSRLARDLEQQLRAGAFVDPALRASALEVLLSMAADLQGRPDDDLT